MTHYETLGVPKDADAAQIKAAFRKLASLHHPDRGDGDHEAMARVNEAYAVLSDPERRKRYDEGGGTGTDTRESRALNHLQQLFAEAIEQDENPILAHVNSQITKARFNIMSQRSAAEVKINRLKKNLGTVTRKSQGENYPMVMIQGRIDKIESVIKIMERDLDDLTRVDEMLKDFEGTSQVLQPGSFTIPTHFWTAT
jgi:curved DNA-binding protein CbpA